MAAGAKKATPAAAAKTTAPAGGDQLSPVEGADADNAMVTPEGHRFFPDSSADALILNADHGAIPEHPDRWPWPGVLVGDDPEAADQPDDEVEPETALPVQPDLLEYCPTRDVCFPYGQPVDAHHVTCVHGEAFADDPESS